MNPSHLSKSVVACVDNGERLLEDAQYFSDFKRYPTAYALLIVAQEEFAKAFMLYLIAEGVIPWNREVRRSLRDHTCKQLFGLIMDTLNPPFEEFLERIENSRKGIFITTLSRTVADAINIFRHEKIRRWKSKNWVWAEPPGYDAAAKRVAEGRLDGQKQDALYVSLGRTGEITSVPTWITSEMVESEYEKTERLGSLVKGIKIGTDITALDYERVKNALTLVFSSE